MLFRSDETYIGGKFDKRRKRQRWDKEAVFGIIERETGRVHAKHLPGRSHLNRWQVAAEIDAVVDQSAHVMTDESRLSMRTWSGADSSTI